MLTSPRGRNSSPRLIRFRLSSVFLFRSKTVAAPKPLEYYIYPCSPFSMSSLKAFFSALRLYNLFSLSLLSPSGSSDVRLRSLPSRVSWLPAVVLFVRLRRRVALCHGVITSYVTLESPGCNRRRDFST